jgi:hypothetical protein
MPPGCGNHLQSAAGPARDPFAALPHALALAVCALLPVDQRLRCSEVCRGWRALLSDASLWLRLDLSAASGVARSSDALLRAAAVRAAGGLQALDLTGCSRVSFGALSTVAAENSAALVELRIAALRDTWPEALALSIQQLQQLLEAAPQLRVLEADARCHGVEEARRLLRNEAPFALPRVHKLLLAGLAGAAVPSFAEDAAAHASLTGVKLVRAGLRMPAALDAVVDAALQLRLTYLDLYNCRLEPASVPSLARLLGGNALRTLVVEGEPATLVDEPAALLLGNALRANTTLTAATFKFVDLFGNAAAAAALLGALTAHPSLRKLVVSGNSATGLEAPVVAAARAALAALVAANAPALQELHMRNCRLGDAGLGALVHALPQNTHLRVLDCSGNATSAKFMRTRLLPAVRANAWLQATL